MPVRFLLAALAALAALAPAFAETAPPAPSPELEQQVLEIIRRHPDFVFEQINRYKEREALAQVIDQFRASLARPTQIDISGAPALGPADAPLTLIEFSDFQSPYCGKVEPVLKSLRKKYGDRLRFVYLHFPLERIHPQAKAAALAAWAAGQQGRFFEYHDRLFERQAELAPPLYEQIARELGLDVARFNADRASPLALAAIEANRRQAEQLKLGGTPAFFLNGGLIPGGMPLAVFEEMFQIALEQKQLSKSPGS